jgi:2-iminobutanoate/2-iminopropanoate deaminase
MVGPEPVVVTDGPQPAGHYSAGIRHGGMVFISGQLGARADGTHTFDESFDVQARAAIDNMLRVLAAAGLGPEDLVKVTAYIVGIDNWPRFDAIYSAAMANARPARAVVPVPELHYGYLVEIEAIAAEAEAR